MNDIMKMAGYVTSHAIWSVGDGETLIPLVGSVDAENKREMVRLMMGSAAAMASGMESVSNLRPGVLGAAFVRDVVATLDSGKTDALAVEIRFAGTGGRRVEVLLPYRHAKHPDGFAVHRPKVTELDGISSDAVEGLMNAFFDGLESHEQGGRLWREKYVDQAGVSVVTLGDDNTELAPEELEFLKRSMVLVFLIVAASDGKVSQKEVKTFAQVLREPEHFGRSPLMTRVATNVITDIGNLVVSIAREQPDCKAELERVRRLIDEKLPAEEGDKFKLGLLMMAYAVAKASGGFFGFGSKVSKEEKMALASIAGCLGVTAA